MLHLCSMTKHDLPKPSKQRHGDNAPQPVRSLRDWLDHLAARNRLAVIKPNVDLRFELAAFAKRLDGQRATLFASLRCVTEKKIDAAEILNRDDNVNWRDAIDAS